MTNLNIENLNTNKVAINNTCLLLIKYNKYYLISFIIWVISIVALITTSIIFSSNSNFSSLFVIAFGLFFILCVVLISLNFSILKKFQEINRVTNEFNKCYRLALLGFLFGILLIIGIFKFLKLYKNYYQNNLSV